jgi:hypothetical protein|tara:strand:+ start:17511 stop:18152 length:642 start_codon:yes stop_codon:yes gene_type:complete
MAVSKKKILDTYCNNLCETGHRPVTVFAFCKELKIDESKFYEHYASFKSLESTIFESFFENTKALLEKDSNYAEADSQNKLLAYYYTFFEVLNNNRTLVTLLLSSEDKNWKMSNLLNKLKTHFQEYIDSLDIEVGFLQNTPLSTYKDKGIRSIAWLQMIKTIDFWMKDESKGFEKTDVYIEKSLRASFDLIHKNPFESLMDFGKFVYHETVKK